MRSNLVKFSDYTYAIDKLENDEYAVVYVKNGRTAAVCSRLSDAYEVARALDQAARRATRSAFESTPTAAAIRASIERG